MLKKALALILALVMAGYPVVACAAPQIPGFYAPSAAPPVPTALPSLRGVISGNINFQNPDSTRLDIIQQKDAVTGGKAIINWQSFDIGSKATVNFKQGNYQLDAGGKQVLDSAGQPVWVPESDYVILNRIYDANPSQIYGTLKADGKIYLINQNGILFGQGSQVNVHALAASALNMKDSDFLGGALKFKAESYTQDAGGNFLPLDSAATVANLGDITTSGLGGSVFLLGPRVVNGGTITSPAGQIGLVAGSAVEFASDPAGIRTAYLVKVTGTPGAATNEEGGSLVADSGMIGMYGGNVNQNGLIRSVTALKKNGQIELMATDSVTLGARSTTATPISDSTETADASFAFTGGKIVIGGLDPNNPANPQTPVKEIDIKGAIEAPSGTVTLQAGQGITLEEGSSINVAGLWNDAPASASTVTATLNSVTLRDDYGQKDGILNGAVITIDPVTGSSIGNLQNSLQVGAQTASERSVAGGSILMSVASGDLNAAKGSLIDFSGGGTRYAAGVYTTTKLVSGNQVYDIGSAPEWLSYRSILGVQTTATHNFGTTGRYVGLYFGGANALVDYHSAHVEGADAGLLQISAPRIVLDAELIARATAGIYQTVISTSDDARKYSIAAGTELPRGGSLVVGDIWSSSSSNLGVDSIVVTPDGAAAAGSASSGPNRTTILSAASLSSAGLSSLSLFANAGITIEKDAAITLNQGGSFSALSRQIVNRGEITTAGGSVTLRTNSNITSTSSSPLYQDVAQNILLAGGSTIDVAGKKVDNSPAAIKAGNSVSPAVISGGSVLLSDDMGILPSEQGNGVVVAGGSTIDVSGGYRIGSTGTITGGNAGSLQISGKGIALDGKLVGLSLPGKTGGSITLHAGRVEVAADAPSPLAGTVITPDRAGTLKLGAHQLDATGFSRVTLLSQGDLTFDANVQFSPSMAKAAIPTTAFADSTGQLAGITYTPPQGLAGSAPSADYVGLTSVTAGSGVLFQRPNGADSLPDTTLTVSAGAGISVASRGTVNLSGEIVRMDGTITAPSGNVAVTAKHGDLTVTGKILAAGYVNQTVSPTFTGQPTVAVPLAGGTVTLSAAEGNLNLANSLIDVSGTAPVNTVVVNDDGSVATVPVAGDAGSVSLTYGTNLTYGTLDARTYGTGMKGGTLSVATSRDMTMTGDLLRILTNNGFDAMSLRSDTSLQLTGAAHTVFGRSLTLDAPVILGDGSAQTLVAPWITIRNQSITAPAGADVAGTSTLNLIGDWIDVAGAVQLSGFQGVSLLANRDISLSDRQYGSDKSWKGVLSTAGDLTLTADNIYPTTLSAFTIRSGGKVTTNPGSAPGAGTILSAGGSLTIEAAGGIEHRGVIRAPMGQITLTSPNGRIFLADGSVLSTKGSAQVSYGTLNDVFWSYLSRSKTNNESVPVTGAPEKSVTVTGSEVITSGGSTIDVSGGGSIAGYQFIPDVQGSNDPFTIAGRYVIMPDQSVSLPGNAIYLAGGDGIKAGTYSILPEQYAFLPGAMVVTDLGTLHTAGANQLSSQGYPIVAGYATVAGTSYGSPLLKNYAIRSAADVLKEGNFSIKTITAGDGGTVTLKGATTIVNGVIKAAALPSTPGHAYKGGSLVLSGTNVTVQQTGASLPAGFGFGTQVPTGLAGTLQLAAAAVSDKGLSSLTLGDIDATESVTIKTGSDLRVGSVTLAAKNTIDVQSGATVNGDTVTLDAPKGTVTIENNATVHGAGTVNIDADKLDLRGNITGDSGSTLNLTGNSVYLAADDYVAKNPSAAPGLYLTAGNWGGFKSFDNISLTSRAGINFVSDFTLTAANRLTLDAGRIAGTGSVAVTVAAGTVAVKNTGTGSSSLTAGTANASLKITADQVELGDGNVAMDGFRTVAIGQSRVLGTDGTTVLQKGTGDITLKGAGSLAVSGDLNLTSARITTAGLADHTAGTYVRPNFTLDASRGNLVIANSGGTAGTAATPGGTLTIRAQGIDQGGVIDLPSGNLTMTTVGSGTDNGIVLRSGSKILAAGTRTETADPASPAYLPGGTVAIATASAPLTVEAGALVDVSAAGTGDAGSISLSALQGGVDLQQTGPAGGAVTTAHLLGNATAGKGGSLTVATDSLDGTRFTGLAARTAEGGFTGGVDVRSRTGNLAVDSATTVRSKTINITADGGSLTVGGTLDASGAGGGSVTLNAGQNLTLQTGGTITAAATAAGAAGGAVSLNSEAGHLSQEAGSVIDVSGGAGGSGGTVAYRARQTTDAGGAYTNVDMSLNGTVKGASSVSAEAFRAYDNTTAIDTAWINARKLDADTFMNTYGATVRNSLMADLVKNGMTDTNFHLLPGIEARSSGDLTLNTALDLTSWRYGINNDPGVLTIRAGGNLAVNATITDHPGTTKSSWGINLASGADLTSADLLATSNRLGNLTIANNTAVFTANAPLRFASGGDTTIRNPYQGVNLTGAQGLGTVPFNLGTYSGSITGRVGGDLVLFGGVIQSATGDMDITTGGDLYLKTQSTTTGSIRTTGTTAGDPYQYWNYAGGGNINLAVKGSVYGSANPSEWDYINDAYGDESTYLWSASYGQNGALPTAGVAAMGGGDVTIRTGGNFTGQAGTFGTGNLAIAAGGDLGGHFLVHDGSGTLTANGNVGNFGLNDHLVIDAFAARLSLAAQGNIELGTVLNPTVVREIRPGEVMPWDLQYGPDSSLSMAAATGDVTILGAARGTVYDNAGETVLPPSLRVYAGHDINLKAQQLLLAPSATGDLRLRAGNDIGSRVEYNGQINPAYLYMSDMDPASVYGVHPDFVASELGTTHSAVPVHMEDQNAVVIDAGGNITDLQLHLPKETWITAGGDISDIYYSSENLHAGDVSKIVAGGDITFKSVQNSSSNGNTGIDQAGPGSLLVQAGNAIDLGTTKGIQSNGNVIDGAYISALGNDGAGLFVVAGTKDDSMDPAKVSNFFNGYYLPPDKDGNEVYVKGLRDYGVEYAELKGSDPAKSAEALASARTLIKDTFGDLSSGGNISMTASQIATLAGKDDISIVAGGKLDVGSTALNQKIAGTGIYTAAAGGSTSLPAATSTSTSRAS